MTASNGVGGIAAVRMAARNQPFGWIAVLGFVNVSGGRTARSIDDYGPVDALFDTFGISAIVFAALAACIALPHRARPCAPGYVDIAVALCATVLILLPARPLSWVGLTSLAF